MQLGESSQRICCWLQIETQCSVKSSGVVGLPLLPSSVDSDLHTLKHRDQKYTHAMCTLSLQLCHWEMEEGPREIRATQLHYSSALDYNRHRI
jgi:hypothetical protein